MLLRWKMPKLAGGYQRGAKPTSGDFPEILEDVLKPRCLIQSTLPSMAAVQSVLDELHAASNEQERIAIITQIIQKFSALEQKWLVRIVLKDHKLGIGDKAILSCLHEDAYRLFLSCSNLKAVCERCANPLERIPLYTVEVGTAVQAMLAKREAIQKIPGLMRGDFAIEQKYDGERVFIHKKGETISYFTRKCIDYTAVYGPKFSSIVATHLKSDSCILDGEMLVWDEEKACFQAFGGNRTHANAKDDPTKGGSTHHFCYVVFDLLVVDNKTIMQLPLCERRNKLEEIIQEEEHVFYLAPQTRASSSTAIVQALNRAVDQGEEGIMLKQWTSSYVPGERDIQWIKCKPDYLNLGDNLDLIVLGGYYGEGRRGGKISHFLLGLLQTVKSESENKNSRNSREEGGDTLKYVPFGKVGSGYTYRQLDEIFVEYKDKWQPYRVEQPPANWVAWKPAAGERPDVWIDPLQSLILEVQAVELNATTKYPSKFTMRFPRVVKVRVDKQLSECMQLHEMLAMAESVTHGGNLNRARVVLDGAALEHSRKGTAKRKRPEVLAQFADTNVANVQVSSQLFAGLEFLVWVDGQQKPELERLIVAYGGKKVQNYKQEVTNFIVCSRLKQIPWKLQNVFDMAAFDVVLPSYLFDCIRENAMLPLHPKYILSASSATKTSLQVNFDQYGDGYFEETTAEELLRVLDEFDVTEPLTTPAACCTREIFRLETGLDVADELDCLRLLDQRVHVHGLPTKIMRRAASEAVLFMHGCVMQEISDCNMICSVGKDGLYVGPLGNVSTTEESKLMWLET
jgi:DNA ligase 4